MSAKRLMGLAFGIGVAVLMMLFVPRQMSRSAAQDAPPPPPPPTVTFASQNMFERGTMIWREDTRQVYVLADPTGANCRGTASVYTENWEEGMPESDPAYDQTGYGKVQPTRGMGQVWRNNPSVREIGYAKGIETGYTALIYQIGDTIWISGENHSVYIIEGSNWKEMDIASTHCFN